MEEHVSQKGRERPNKRGKMEQLTMDLGKGESCEGMQYSQK